MSPRWVAVTLAIVLCLLAGCGGARPAATLEPAMTRVPPTGTPVPATGTPGSKPPSATPAPARSATPLPPTPEAELTGTFDVGGHRLYIQCTGSGSPAVILEAGYNDTGQTWSEVQPAVAEFTRVCAYDRAGLGRSDRIPEELGYVQAVVELHTLLRNAGVDGPYVLVGHSAGGWNVRLYADRYADQVAGLVLVDSSHPDQFRRNAEVLPPESPGDSESLRFYREWFTTATRDPALTPELYAPGSLGDLPLVVITAPEKQRADDLPAGLSAEFDRIWVELQGELARLSSASTHVFAEGSSHFIQHDRPDLVIEAIRQVVEAVRQAP